jgi:hypothetical protein
MTPKQRDSRQAVNMCERRTELYEQASRRHP